MVLDTVGSDLFSSCLRTLRVGGRQIAIANVAGPDTEVHFNLTEFYRNQIHLIGDTFKLTGPGIADIMNYLSGGFEAGFLQVSEPERNEFDKAVEAYTKLSEKRSRAKQVLTFDKS